MPGVDLSDQIWKGKEYSIRSTSGKNLHGRFSELFKELLTQRPKDSVELIGDYLKVKGSKESRWNIGEQAKFAESQLKLFESNKDEEYGESKENEEEFDIPLPNCSQSFYMFEQASIGLGREETQRIFLSMKQLVYNFPLANVRFWGKIFGVERNYLIAEAEYREGEGEEEDDGKEDDKNDSDSLAEDDKEDGPVEESDLPKSTWKPPPIIPKEEPRTGANKKIYFVCNYAGDQWIKLPNVTPDEICAARKIVKLFTGDLEKVITTYPPFPGLEKNFLRAQIARISASTQISPAGYYMFDEEDEEEEDEIHESYTINVEFEGCSLQELVDSSMQSWVHHTQHILPQGRCSWFNPFEKPDGDDFEEDELDDEEVEPEPNYPQPETGPQLLSSVSNDQNISSTTPPWTVVLSSKVLPEYALAVAKSNIWPGAFAIAKGTFFENIYIGWGQKYYPNSFTPLSPPCLMEEYPEDLNCQEQDDPTVEEEQNLKEREDEALRAAQEMENAEEEDDDDD